MSKGVKENSELKNIIKEMYKSQANSLSPLSTQEQN